VAIGVSPARVGLPLAPTLQLTEHARRHVPALWCGHVGSAPAQRGDALALFGGDIIEVAGVEGLQDDGELCVQAHGAPPLLLHRQRSIPS
jgi:hypothetical protein